MADEKENQNQPEPKPQGEAHAKAEKPHGDKPHGEKQPKGEKHAKADKGGEGGGAPKEAGAPKQGGGGGKEGKGKGGGKSKGVPKIEIDKTPAEPGPPPRFRDKFMGPVSEKVKQEFNITNPMALPRLQKIVLTVGIGKQLEGTKLNPKAKEQVLKDLAVISGQKPVMNKAKKSVANFKLRSGYEVGAMVTLRGARMWEFFDRLVSLAIPRIKDFRGLNPKSFDGRGNYSFGIAEQGIFPEVNMAEAEFTHGMHITFVFKNSTNDRSLAVLREMGVPFSKPEDQQRFGRRTPAAAVK